MPFLGLGVVLQYHAFLEAHLGAPNVMLPHVGCLPAGYESSVVLILALVVTV